VKTPVAIFTGNATSLQNVSEDIRYVAAQLGYRALVNTQIYPDLVYKRRVDAVIFVYPLDPVYAVDKAMYFYEFRNILNDNAVWYTTVEGRPAPWEVRTPVWRYVEVYANSKFTEEKLREAGIQVVDTVPHGVRRDKVERALKLKNQYEKKIRSEYGDRVVFACVSHNHPRKNLEGLEKAVALLNEKHKDDFAVLLISDAMPEVENMYFVTDMGKLSHEEVLAFMAACDYLVFPTMAEGFGLPVLEANAVGTPALHCDMPPLNEFSDPSANITWDFEAIEFVNLDIAKGGGIEFELHKFQPSAIAEAMELAIDLKKNKPDEYEERRAKARESVEPFDAEILYRKFFDNLTLL
jgi:glycosyltransferase involved in cell wall biosynthesis